MWVEAGNGGERAEVKQREQTERERRDSRGGDSYRWDSLHVGQQVIRRRWDRDGGDTQSLRKGSAGKTEQGNDR